MWLLSFGFDGRDKRSFFGDSCLFVFVCVLRRVRQLGEKEEQNSKPPSGKRAAAQSGNELMFPTCSYFSTKLRKKEQAVTKTVVAD